MWRLRQSAYRTGACDTLYLQANDIFDECLPRLKEKLLDAARQADAAQGWNLLQAAQRGDFARVRARAVTTHGSSHGQGTLTAARSPR